MKFWLSRGDIGVIMNAEKYYDYNYIRHLELGSYLFPMVLLSSFFFKNFQIKFIFKVKKFFYLRRDSVEKFCERLCYSVKIFRLEVFRKSPP